jgi:ribonucleoside-diphosphate reductase alpha chain
MSDNGVTSLPPETLAALDHDSLRARIFYEKYALRNSENDPVEKLPEQMWKRLAAALASVERPEQWQEWETNFLWLLSDFRFVPGGRILHAIGNPNKVTALNCYVIPSPHDSIAGIYRTAQELAETFKRGGGCGVDISSLRPNDSPAHNAARVSTGAVSFMELYSLTTGIIGQQGRRGALMITISDSHPDVLDFCKIKRNRNSVRYANISVRVTDAFMRAVERDDEWVLQYENSEDGIEVKRPIRARELWNELTIGARDWAEPGCLFWDTIRRYSSSDRYPGMEVVSTNPCLRGSMRVLTRQGLIPIAELDGKESEIYLGNNLWGRARFWKSGRKPVYRLTLSNGLTLEATQDHLIDFGGGDLALGNTRDLRTYSFLGDGSWDGVDPEISAIDLVKLGFIHGDGFWHGGGGLYAGLGARDGDVRNLLENEGGTPHGRRHIYFPLGYRITTLAAELKIAEGHLPERRLPEAVLRASPGLAKAFLKGLFSANGSVITSDSGRVALKTSCEELAQDVQLLLCALGYASYITTNPAHPVEFPNGTYVCRESYDLNVSGRWARKFHDEIGFIQTYKMEKLAALKQGRCFNRRPAKVVNIERIGEDDVYDFSQPETSHGWVNGFRVHNCAEEPLDPYGDCCIGSINLAAFVNDSHSPAKVDLVSLEKATRCAVRFLDNVLSWNEGRHPLPGQEEAALKGRRIGLGIMGLADMLCKLKVRYDSDEGIELAERTVEKIKLWAYDESAEIAAQKGPFPVFNAANHLDNPFFKDFPHELIEKIENEGLRNVTLLTIPPTGSIAAMAGVTSGIEPIFDLKYVRRSESLSESLFEVEHPLVAEYKKTNGPRKDEPLPSYFVTAHAIAPEKRVLMQAGLQRHIDQAISSTINLPKDTPVETIERIYRMAWEQGLKGITVYREGSREGILLTEKQAKRQAVKIVPAKVTPRPATLNGVTARERTPFGTAFVTINYANGNPREPFEVFVRLGKAGSDLEADAEALGRLLSLVLRLPSPMTREERLREVIDQLEHIGGSRFSGFGTERVRSMPDGVARVLSRWLETVIGTEPALTLQPIEDAVSRNGRLHSVVSTGDFCPRCRQASLITQQGCLRCTDCGYKEC